MASRRITSKEFSIDERNLWKNLEVNLDSFSNRWEDLYLTKFQKELQKLPPFLVRKLNGVLLNKKDDDNIETLLQNRRASIITFCIITFSIKNYKAIADVLGIPYTKKNMNYGKIVANVFDQYHKKNLPEIFLFILRRLSGSGREYYFTDPIKQNRFNEIVGIMPKLALKMKRRDKDKKIYEFRFSYQGKNGEWVFLLLKETNDRVHRAIPNNISMVSGQYKIIQIDPVNKLIQINTKSKEEALTVRNFFTRYLKNPGTFRREEATYEPKQFFKKILSETKGNQLFLVGVKNKSDNTALRLNLQDPELKHDIVTRLKIYKKNNILRLEDFSEFESLTFKYKSLLMPVHVYETSWGTHRLNLVDRRISSADISAFKNDFKRKYGVELNKWLKRSDEELNRSFLISKILDRKTVPVNIIIKEVEEVLFSLIKDKILSKIQHQAKRICTNPSCRKKTWDNDSCPSCGGELKIDGDYVNIITDQKGIYDFTYRQLLTAKDELKATRFTTQIDRKKFSLIEVMNKAGDSLTIYIASADIPREIESYYHHNGLPLLIILTHYKDAISTRIRGMNFECMGIVDFYSNARKPGWIKKTFSSFIIDQKIKWNEKLLEKGFNSYKSLTNKLNGYNAQHFETDIFNMMHELFCVAYKLGGSFTGVKAPDGIAAIRNYNKPLQKFCLSWDCKYSGKPTGYAINEPPEKHRHYIKVLDKNPKVKFYGTLKVHAIISQNMDAGKYTRFYSKLVHKFKWKGAVIFIHENIITGLYVFFRKNSQKIRAKPEIFYTALHRMLLKIHVKDQLPFPSLIVDRLNLFYEEVIDKYSAKHIELDFKRSDF